MSQFTPTNGTASAKRKVMGRMDVPQSDSPSSNITPTARPRILRAPHGASSPALTSATTSSVPRSAAVGTTRARVDMSAFASPTNGISASADSPGMSPSIRSSQSFFASTSSAGQNQRPSMQSPSLRPGPFVGHVRANSALGTSSPSIKLGELSREDEVRKPDSPFTNFQALRVRSKTDNVDLAAPNHFVSPSVAGKMQASASASPRVLPTGAQPAPNFAHRASAPTQAAKPAATGFMPTPRASMRPPLSPQRSSRDTSTFPSPKAVSRPASPSANSTRPSSQAVTPASHHQQLPERYSSSTNVPSAATALYAVSTPTASCLGRSQSFASLSSDAHTAASSTLKQSETVTLSSQARRPSNLGGVPRASAPTALHIPRQANDATGLTSPISPSRWTFGTTRPSTGQKRSSIASSTASSSAPSMLSPGLSETPVKTLAEVAAAEEARVHRKLLDLEITNKSLLAINSALEVTKLRQTQEIRELKRRLRQGSRSQSVDPSSRDNEICDSDTDEDDSSDRSTSDADEDDILVVREDPELEAAYVRCRTMIDSMLAKARESILSRSLINEASTGGKVLHPVEVEQMLRDQQADESQQDDDHSSMMQSEDVTGDGDSTMSLDLSVNDTSALSDSPSDSSTQSSSDSSSIDIMMTEGNTSSSTSNISNDNHAVHLLDPVLTERLLSTPKYDGNPGHGYFPPVGSTAADPTGDVSID